MWNRLLLFLEFPLLRRELTEAAGRRRTWVLRVVVLLVLMFVMLSSYSSLVSRAQRTGGPISFLGTGFELLSGLLIFDLWAMLLLLPALTCSAIASERERQTLGLMLVSRLTPGSIVLEKFLARLLPMAWLLLLTGPLLGISYSLGGFSRGILLNALLVLFLAALQISSTAMLWSSLLETAVSAFWMTYVTLILMAAGPPLVAVMFLDWETLPTVSRSVSVLFTGYLQALSGELPSFNLLVAGLPVMLMSLLMIVVSGVAVSRYREEAPLTGRRVVRGVAWVLAWILTRPHWVVRRLWGGSKGVVLAEGPAVVDAPAVVRRVENKAETLVSRVLPEFGVIAWRERTLSVLARVRGQIFLGLAVLFFLVWVSSDGLSLPAVAPVIITSSLLMILGVAAVMSTAARCIVFERERQTLEILLTVPISNRDFLLGKAAGASRIRAFVMVLTGLLLLYRLRIDEKLGWAWDGQNNWLVYVVRTVAFNWLHLSFGLWLGLYFSLRSKSQMKATVATLLGVLAFALGPAFLIGMLPYDARRDVGWLFLMAFYPVGMGVLSEIRELPPVDGPLVFSCVFFCLLFYAALVWGLRAVVLRTAAGALQREG